MVADVSEDGPGSIELQGNAEAWESGWLWLDTLVSEAKCGSKHMNDNNCRHRWQSDTAKCTMNGKKTNKQGKQVRFSFIPFLIVMYLNSQCVFDEAVYDNINRWINNIKLLYFVCAFYSLANSKLLFLKDKNYQPKNLSFSIFCHDLRPNVRTMT